MSLRKHIGELELLLTSIIWGAAFVAQSSSMDSLEPCTFNSMRSLLAAVALLPIIYFQDHAAGHRFSLMGMGTKTTVDRKNLLIGGVLCGLCLTSASICQQFGIKYTTVAKAGFITALYIIFVPLYGLFFGRRPGWWIGSCAAAAMAGMYILCCGFGTLHLGIGDIWVLGCAVLFALHITVVEHFAPHVDCVRMSAIQLLLTGILCGIAAICRGEPVSCQAIRQATIPILWCGIMSSGVGYTLQIVGQKSVHPAVASLLMSLESVFSAVFGWLLLNQKLSPREIAGCAIIFVAVLAAQKE